MSNAAAVTAGGAEEEQLPQPPQPQPRGIYHGTQFPGELNNFLIFCPTIFIATRLYNFFYSFSQQIQTVILKKSAFDS